MSTITAGDYTVEFKINSVDYMNWKDQVYRPYLENEDEGSQKSPALYLKEYMIPIIE